MPEEKERKMRWEDFGLIGALVLFLLLALLCYFKIICPAVTCPEGMYTCDICEGGCCLPGGICPCPPPLTLCPPQVNCPSGCCLNDSCVIGKRSIYNASQFWSPQNATSCPPGIECASGICVGNCCIFECKPEIAATCDPAVNENATGGCTADGMTCIYKCDRPECMGCCDQYNNCLGGKGGCIPHYGSCATNESCCSGICKDDACYCIPSGTDCSSSAQCCSLNCIIPEGQQTGLCGYDCGTIDCSACIAGSCGGTGQKSCMTSDDCVGGVCNSANGCIFCPEGSHWDAEKNCCVFDTNPNECIPKCPDGMAYNVAKGMCCVIGDPTKCCPPGSFYNRDKDACCLIADSTKCCPLGRIWNEEKSCCVDIWNNCEYDCSTIDCTKCITKDGLSSCGGTGQLPCTADSDCANIKCDREKGCGGYDCSAIDCSKCIDGSCGGTGSISCTPETEATVCSGLSCDPYNGCTYPLPPFDCSAIDCKKCIDGSCGGTGSISCTPETESIDCSDVTCDPYNGCGKSGGGGGGGGVIGCTDNSQCRKCGANGKCGGIGPRTCQTDADCATSQCSAGMCDGFTPEEIIPSTQCTEFVTIGHICNSTTCCTEGFCFRSNPSAEDGVCCTGAGWQCYIQCSDTKPCPEGYQCIDGRCH